MRERKSNFKNGGYFRNFAEMSIGFGVVSKEGLFTFCKCKMNANSPFFFPDLVSSVEVNAKFFWLIIIVKVN